MPRLTSLDCLQPCSSEPLRQVRHSPAYGPHTREDQFEAEAPHLALLFVEDDLFDISPSELAASIPHPSSFFHENITTALIEAGFRVGRVRKHDFFHMWSATFYAQESLHGRMTEVKRTIRKILRAKRLLIQSDTFVLSLQCKRGVMAFVLPSEPWNPPDAEQR